MIEKGIIVSIQKYSQITTQELATAAIEGGAVAIRTDQPIRINKPVIGLQKLENKKYYITTSRKSISEISRWSHYIAIDSRRGNEDLELLYAHCHINCFSMIADIETIDDVKNIINICQNGRIMKPIYLATTFNFDKFYLEKAKLIKEIKKITDIPIIAEGGYGDRIDINCSLKAGAGNVCIGSAISDICKITKEYKRHLYA